MADEEKKAERNPVIVPVKEEVQAPCCPYCGSKDFEGWAVQGVVTRKCSNKACGKKWSPGGLPVGRADPRLPMPPDNYVPPTTLEKSLFKNIPGSRDLPAGYVERTRPVDQRPEFKKGLPISDDEEL